MDLVTGAMGSLISKLGELLLEEYKLHRGFPAKIRSLKQELESAHAALRAVAGIPPDQLDDQVRIWARQVREASYDMEDVLDTFLVHRHDNPADHESLRKRLSDKVRGISNLFKYRKISGTIVDIHKRLEEATRRYGRYTVDSVVLAKNAAATSSSTIDPRLAAMYKEVTQLVGIHKPSTELTAMLSLQGQGDQKVVSVVGVGGLGKTTLAKEVYDKLKVDFQCTAFVPVGRNPDLKKFFRDLLIELDKAKYVDPKITILDERQLIDELRLYLGTKRYFIVIDDIWETKLLETIKLALVMNNNGSRIIVTTRKVDVAKQADDVYELQPLPYEKSRKLLYMRIFGGEGRCLDRQLDEVSDKIIKKCGGVPLAIITMSSLLVGKSREEWIQVCDSFAFRDKHNNQISDTEWILSLSYYDLPAHLKTCLLYLCAFPEDYYIDKDSLIWKWVAEGFVHEDPGTRLFEVGEGYFNELINRSMIIAVESDNYSVNGCRVHDMVLDLLRVKAHEENFVTTIPSTDVHEGTSLSRTVRRLALQNKVLTLMDNCMDLTHLRSFIACRCDISDLVFPLSFKLLRVLAFENCGLQCSVPLGELIHLRYIRLGPFVSEFPKGIEALKLLQTLDLEGTNLIDELPLSVGLLTQLVCLRAKDTIVPDGVIGRLTSLEELQVCVGDDAVGQFVKDLRNLHELRVLKAMFDVGDSIMESDLAVSLNCLRKIRHIALDGRITHPNEALWDAVVLSRQIRHLSLPHFYFSKLPSCINPSELPGLTALDLSVRHMDEWGLKILGAFQELRHLKLDTYSMATVAVDDGCFPKLRSCLLHQSTVRFVPNKDLSVSFTIWNTRDDGAPSTFGSSSKTMVPPLTSIIMPNLEVLCFQVDVRDLIRNNVSCDDLGLKHLPSLQKVQVRFSCHYAIMDDVIKEEAALRQAIEVHPNQPTLQMDIYGEDEVKR